MELVKPFEPEDYAAIVLGDTNLKSDLTGTRHDGILPSGTTLYIHEPEDRELPTAELPNYDALSLNPSVVHAFQPHRGLRPPVYHSAAQEVTPSRHGATSVRKAYSEQPRSPGPTNSDATIHQASSSQPPLRLDGRASNVETRSRHNQSARRHNPFRTGQNSH